MSDQQHPKLPWRQKKQQSTRQLPWGSSVERWGFRCFRRSRRGWSGPSKSPNFHTLSYTPYKHTKTINLKVSNRQIKQTPELMSSFNFSKILKLGPSELKLRTHDDIKTVWVNWGDSTSQREEILPLCPNTTRIKSLLVLHHFILFIIKRLIIVLLSVATSEPLVVLRNFLEQSSVLKL